MIAVTEGEARITLGKGVFYNPNMKKLRDLSVLFLRAVGAKDAYLLDATSATGIRAIRYAKEVGIKSIIALDINKAAYRNTLSNVKRNGLKLKVVNEGIQEFANTCNKPFGIIDLDPFGTPIHYVHDLLKISNDDTIIMATATDTAVLCGAHESACVRLYGSRPLHNDLCKEVGIRILINYFARAAAQFNFGVDVLLSISDMHYMRIFLRLKRGAKEAKESMKATGFGSYCRKCHALDFRERMRPTLPGKCRHCNSEVETFGPLWLGPLNDKELIGKMVSLTEDTGLERQLRLIHDELDTRLFYYLPRITKDLKIGSVSASYVMGELKKGGHKASLTQFEREGIKSDASAEDITRIIKKRTWRTGKQMVQ